MKRGRSVLFVLATALVVTASGRAPGDSPVHDLCERFTSPVRGEVWRAVRDDDTGQKWFVSENGERAASPDAIARREFEALAPMARIVERELLASAQDPSRAAETADVTLFLREQPAYAEGAAARERFAPLVAGPLARSRAILAALARRRAVDGVATAEEDAQLLTPAEQSDLAVARDEVLRLCGELRSEVSERASVRAAADQARLVAWLSARSDTTLLGTSWILSTVSARLPLGTIEDLVSRFPEIGGVARSGICTASLNVSVPTISASTWWNAGYTGSSGAKVAVLDTGIDATHPALSVTNASVHLNTAKFYSDFNDSATSTDDRMGHGTHVGGIVASNDSTNRGVAYGAGLMNAKCGYLTTSGGGSLADPDIYAAGDWAAANGAAVMNCSFGGGFSNDGSSGNSLFFDAATFDLGISVAIAAGNSGSSSGSVSAPSDGYGVISVGAFDDNGTTGLSDDSLVSFSSRGPTSDGRRKPDISAPGYNINSCNATWEGSNPDFVSYSGTSMAAPHVAGALAILRGAAASWTPEGVKALLLTTARNTSPAPSSPDDNWGYGGLDLGRAYTYRGSVAEGSFTATGQSYALLRLSSLASGSRVTLAWNRHVQSNLAQAPVTSYALSDLDLYVYDADGTAAGSSTSAVNSVEQVKVTSAVSSPIVRIALAGGYPSGASSEPFAIASETTGNATSVVGPVLSCTFTQAPPADVGASATFAVEVTVTNSGDLTALAPSATLTLPAGYSVVGSESRSLADLAVNSSATASFQVTAASGPSGNRTLRTAAASSAYGVTMSSPTVSASQRLDADPPAATLTIESGATYTRSAAVTLTLTASDPLSGVDSMRVRDQGGTWGTWMGFATSAAWSLPTQGTCAVEAEVRDHVGNVAALVDEIVFDADPPTGSVSFDGGVRYTTATSAEFTVVAADAVSGLAGQRISTDGVQFGDWEPSGTTHTVALSGEGTVTRWAQLRDVAGNVSTAISGSISRDLTAPTGSFVIEGGASMTNHLDVRVDITATDAVSGLAELRVSTDGVSWSGWIPFASSIGVGLPYPDTTNTVRIQLRDGAGNVSPTYSRSIVVDGTGPTGSVTVEGGARFTARRDVVATISATDALTGVASMRVAVDDGAWGAWQPLESTLPWALAEGEGPRTLRVEFQDGSGNVSDAVAATITRDLTAPVGVVTAANGAFAVNHEDVLANVAATDTASGVAEVRIAVDAGDWSAWLPFEGAIPAELPTGDGEHVVHAQFRDAVGNESGVVEDGVLLDTRSPAGTIELASGAARILPWEDLQAQLTADDDQGVPESGSGVVWVQFSYDGGASWTQPRAPAATMFLTRPTTIDAEIEVRARFGDAAGNVSQDAIAAAYFVPTPAQDLTVTKSLLGTFAAGGDVDAYWVDLLAGEVLDVRAKGRGSHGGASRRSLSVELDLYGPSLTAWVEGRFPAKSRRAGISRFVAPESGRYVVVAHPADGDLAAGGDYALTTSIRRSRATSRVRGRAPDHGQITFAAVNGSTLRGSAHLEVYALARLIGPDGVSTDVVLHPRRNVVPLSVPIDRGTGAYTLRFETPLPVSWSLTIVPPPRTGRVLESPPPGQR